MIRKLIFSTIAATALTGAAFAADLPSRKAPPPAFVPPPIMTWTGLYVGVNGGALWNNSRNFQATGYDFGGTAFPVASAAAALAATNNIPTGNRTQFLVGGTWGYNWQFNNIVLGTESDFQGVFGCRNDNDGFFYGNNNRCGGSVFSSVTTPAVVGAAVIPGVTVGNLQSVTHRLDYLSTSRVRAGFLVTPSLLVYGTGGVAIGKVRANSTVVSGGLIGVAAVSTYDYSQLKAGFVAGGGLEWMIFKDWSLKVEGLYYDLGRSRIDQAVQQIGPGSVLLTNTGVETTWRNNGIIARGGLNYHIHWFDAAPVVARY